MTDVLQKQMQKRAELLELHFQNWKQLLSVENETWHSLKDRQQQEISQFSQSDLSSVEHGWKTLLRRLLQEREDLIQANVVRRQSVRQRHAEEKLLLNVSISA